MEVTMFKKVAFLAVVAVLALSATAVYASGNTPNPHPGQDYNSTDNTWVPAFQDGRINAFNMTEPAAVYYTYSNQMVTDQSGVTQLQPVVTGISVWVIDGDGVGQQAFLVPVSTINAAMASSHAVTVLGSGQGMTLTYTKASNAFTISGRGYTFSWTAY
jgi:hypothetical protein